MTNEPVEEHADFCTCPACEAKRNQGKTQKVIAAEEHHNSSINMLRNSSATQGIRHFSVWDAILIIFISLQILIIAWNLMSVVKGNSSLAAVTPALIISGAILVWDIRVLIKR